MRRDKRSIITNAEILSDRVLKSDTRILKQHIWWRRFRMKRDLIVLFQIHEQKFKLFSRLTFKYHSSSSENTALSKNLYALHLRIVSLGSSQMKNPSWLFFSKQTLRNSRSCVDVYVKYLVFRRHLLWRALKDSSSLNIVMSVRRSRLFVKMSRYKTHKYPSPSTLLV